jgi:HlyD family secretion protein
MAPTEPLQAQPRRRGSPWNGPTARPLVSALGLLAVASLLWWTLLRPKSEPKQVPLAPRQITALGRLTPNGGLVKLAVESGTGGGNEVVERWFVTEGSTIHKGQLLARLSSWKQPQAALKQTEAELRSERSLLPYLVVSKARAKVLFREGAISKKELRKAEASVAAKKAAIIAGEAAVQRAHQQISAAEVRSPLDGTLIRIYSWPGMKQTDWGLAVIGRTSAMQVWAQVFQSDVIHLQPGQRARIKAENGGFKGELEARLSSVVGQVSDRDLFSINSNNNVNVKVVLVKLDVDPAEGAQLEKLAGLNVTVRFDGSIDHQPGLGSP